MYYLLVALLIAFGIYTLVGNFITFPTKRTEKAMSTFKRKQGIGEKFYTKKVDGYIKLTKGEISDEEFQAITTDIEKQIALCNEQMQMQQEKTLSAEDLSVLQLFGKYVGIKELTNEILSDVIKSIYVYNDKRIKIVWNFKERLVENVICEEKETSA